MELTKQVSLFEFVVVALLMVALPYTSLKFYLYSFKFFFLMYVPQTFFSLLISIFIYIKKINKGAFKKIKFIALMCFDLSEFN